MAHTAELAEREVPQGPATPVNARSRTDRVERGTRNWFSSTKRKTIMETDKQLQTDGGNSLRGSGRGRGFW